MGRSGNVERDDRATSVKSTSRVPVSLTEETLARYFQLNKEAKAIEKELAKLKKTFNDYFDQLVGERQKGEFVLGNYKLQRQIRTSESYLPQETVQKLEALQLTDCVQIVKRPDEQKIDAAVTLGLLAPDTLEDCKVRKMSAAIYVREV